MKRATGQSAQSSQQSDPNQIDIKNMSKVEVLYYLYQYARGTDLTMKNLYYNIEKRQQINVGSVRRAINESSTLYFDYVAFDQLARHLKISLDNEKLDVVSYNKANGFGMANQAISALRADHIQFVTNIQTKSKKAIASLEKFPERLYRTDVNLLYNVLTIAIVADNIVFLEKALEMHSKFKDKQEGIEKNIVGDIINGEDTDGYRFSDLKGRYPLHEAIISQNKKAVELLLQYGADIETEVVMMRDNSFHLAMCVDNIEILELVLEQLKGMSEKKQKRMLDKKADDNLTVLQLAIKNNYDRHVSAILKSFPSLLDDTKVDDEPILHSMVIDRKFKMVDCALNAMPRLINQKMPDGQVNLLHSAVRVDDNKRIIKLLLDKGISLLSQASFALLATTYASNEAIFGSQNDDKLDVLGFAIMCGCAKNVEYLLKYAKDKEIKILNQQVIGESYFRYIIGLLNSVMSDDEQKSKRNNFIRIIQSLLMFIYKPLEISVVHQALKTVIQELKREDDVMELLRFLSVQSCINIIFKDNFYNTFISIANEKSFNDVKDFLLNKNKRFLLEQTQHKEEKEQRIIDERLREERKLKEEEEEDIRDGKIKKQQRIERERRKLDREKQQADFKKPQKKKGKKALRDGKKTINKNGLDGNVADEYYLRINEELLPLLADDVPRSYAGLMKFFYEDEERTQKNNKDIFPSNRSYSVAERIRIFGEQYKKEERKQGKNGERRAAAKASSESVVNEKDIVSQHWLDDNVKKKKCL